MPSYNLDDVRLEPANVQPVLFACIVLLFTLAVYELVYAILGTSV